MILLVCVLMLLAREDGRQSRMFAFSPSFFLLTGLFFVLLGSYLTTRSSGRCDKNHFSHLYQSGDLVRILLQKRISKRNGRQRFQARVISSNNRPCQGKIYVSIAADSLENSFFYGDTLWTRNYLYRIRPPKNPGAFDFQNYAAGKNIFHQLYLKRGEFVLARGKNAGLLRSSVRLNGNLQRALEKVLKEPGELSVAKALLLGDRNEIPVELLNSFKGAGAMHILAISGLHVGIIHLIFMFLTRPLVLLRNGRIIRVIFILLGLWSYALLTGMAVSATRSVSMFTLFTLGRFMNRKITLLGSLVNSAFVLLILNPMFLFDVGFQLSYSALMGIAVVAILIERKKRREKPASKIQKYFLGLILLSCSAQFGVMPLSLYYFKQFSGLFLISSILVLPALGITLIFGYAVLGASLIFNISLFVKEAFQAWLKLINRIIEWVGSIDSLILKGVYFPFSFWFIMSLSLFLLTMGFLKRKSILIYASGICLISMQLIWIHQRVSVIRNEKLVVFHQRGGSLVVKRKGSILELKNCKKMAQGGEKHLEEYSSLFPGDFSICFDEGGTKAPLQFFYVQRALIYVIDDQIDHNAMAVLCSIKRNPDIVVFSNAPRFNLERLLTQIRPGIVVADGSNHRAFVQRCRATCHSLGIEFHATLEKGAFLYPK